MSQTVSAPTEQTRARYPDEEGFIERDGVRVFWERYGEGEPTVLLLPTWSIVSSRHWKGQIPYLSRHARVLTFDGRGNGRSDRPSGAAAYSVDEFAADALAVLDATGTDRAFLAGLSCGARWGVALAADHPERVDGLICICPAVKLAPDWPQRTQHSFEDDLDTDEGWAKYNRHYWERDYEGFLEFFFGQGFVEPHSTKQLEDCIGWAHQTTPETLIETTRGLGIQRAERLEQSCARVRCPVLVIHGDRDLIRPHAQGRALAQATGGRLVTLHGSGHFPLTRDPVVVCELMRKFIAPRRPPTRWARAALRPPRALFISSPIGLGHARRDVAIARELRRLHPGLEVDWLAQPPVTTLLEAAGERIHPASAELAGESAHIEAEAGEHQLHAFQAIRRMDEILLANFMVFRDLVLDEEPYDVWIGDEAWELDHFLHENPELKSAAYAWLSDFVGFLPMPEGGAREAELTADYNAEMLEHIARYPRVRDRSIFIGEPEDIVADSFGHGLPAIREWTERHFAFSGYITGFDPRSLPDRKALRAELGLRASDQLVVVSVGGSGVGVPLLRRVIDAFAHARDRAPQLRMLVVAGPRIDAGALPAPEGVEVRAYVHDLYRQLAACDLAIVQGGLATTMELTALQRPFLYFPLREHFEQRRHVRHRLERHGAGRPLEFDDCPPEKLADAILEELGRPVSYRPVPVDGAARAAAEIAALL
ncbi:MAG TPA: alpha/beta fold hydrolase [Solirubrobacteraceae bacterium]|nr:alpha/beta fold hydrolase [Solirubrobacteraceae bacterium]